MEGQKRRPLKMSATAVPSIWWAVARRGDELRVGQNLMRTVESQSATGRVMYPENGPNESGDAGP
jgi:hypothetical protein